MKKFFLHIGAGKTGTSALQANFSINREFLLSFDYFYPKSENDEKAKNLEVTSGNAIKLAELLKKDFIKEKELEDMLKSYILKAKNKNIIFSSEALEIYNINNASLLKKIALKNEYKVIVIYYIRAIGDHLMSSYHQLLKRNCYTKDFEFILQNKNNRFLSIIDKTINVFGKENTIIKNYDYVKENIFEDFLKSILNISEVNKFKIEKNKINRSLTDFEVHLMKYINKFLNKNSQSAFISNALIGGSSSKKEYNFFITKDEYTKIELLYKQDVILLNNFLNEKEKPLKLINNMKIINERENVTFTAFQKAILSILAEIVKIIKK